MSTKSGSVAAASVDPTSSKPVVTGAVVAAWQVTPQQRPWKPNTVEFDQKNKRKWPYDVLCIRGWSEEPRCMNRHTDKEYPDWYCHNPDLVACPEVPPVGSGLRCRNSYRQPSCMVCGVPKPNPYDRTPAIKSAAPPSDAVVSLFEYYRRILSLVLSQSSSCVIPEICGLIASYVYAAQPTIGVGWADLCAHPSNEVLQNDLDLLAARVMSKHDVYHSNHVPDGQRIRWFLAYIDQVEFASGPTRSAFAGSDQSLWALLPPAPPAGAATTDHPHPSSVSTIGVPRIHIASMAVYDSLSLQSECWEMDVEAPNIVHAADNPKFRTIIHARPPTAECDWRDDLHNPDRPDGWYSLFDLELAPYQSKVVVPRDYCFGDGRVWMADGTHKHVSLMKTGDRVRCVVHYGKSVPTAVAGSGADPYALPYVIRSVSKVFTDPQPDVFRMVAVKGSASAALDIGQCLITRGHPIFVNGEWMRPDELDEVLIPRRLVVYNYQLSNEYDRSSDAVSGESLSATRSIVVSGVIASTIGSDCGSRLAAKYPEYHSKYGPNAVVV